MAGAAGPGIFHRWCKKIGFKTVPWLKVTEQRVKGSKYNERLRLSAVRQKKATCEAGKSSLKFGAHAERNYFTYQPYSEYILDLIVKWTRLHWKSYWAADRQLIVSYRYPNYFTFYRNIQYQTTVRVSRQPSLAVRAIITSNLMNGRVWNNATFLCLSRYSKILKHWMLKYTKNILLIWSYSVSNWNQNFEKNYKKIMVFQDISFHILLPNFRPNLFGCKATGNSRSPSPLL